jgi:hypothetical protein
MKQRLICFILAGILGACNGIPLRSMPRLMGLQQTLLTASAAEFMLAIQVDARMVPPSGSAPVMLVNIRPREPGAFDSSERKLTMRLSSTSPTSHGLATPPVNRRWLIYSFPPESQRELSRIQEYFKNLQARSGAKSGGSVSIGISQSGLAATDPALANTRWESWLQTSHREGFFELWSGSIAELLKLANNEAAPPAH